MIQMNLQPRNKVTDLENKLMTTKGEKQGWRYKQWNTTQPEKKNEIMPSATIWMDLETVILSEVSQTKTNIT